MVAYHTPTWTHKHAIMVIFSGCLIFVTNNPICGKGIVFVIVRSAFDNEDICEVVGPRCERILLDVFANTSPDTPANTCKFTLLMPWHELGGGAVGTGGLCRHKYWHNLVVENVQLNL